MDQAITTLIRAGFVNQGEVCLCTSRIFVHEKVYDEFVEKYVRREKYAHLILSLNRVSNELINSS